MAYAIIDNDLYASNKIISMKIYHQIGIVTKLEFRAPNPISMVCRSLDTSVSIDIYLPWSLVIPSVVGRSLLQISVQRPYHQGTQLQKIFKWITFTTEDKARKYSVYITRLKLNVFRMCIYINLVWNVKNEIVISYNKWS